MEGLPETSVFTEQQQLVLTSPAIKSEARTNLVPPLSLLPSKEPGAPKRLGLLGTPQEDVPGCKVLLFQ